MAKRTQSEPGSSRSSGRRRAAGPQTHVPPFRGTHYRLLGVALGVILLGFVALAYESITLAPLLMVSGYCVGIPLVLTWRGKSARTGSANDRESRQP